jgi:NADH-quinone oxidoreductase subunit K
LVNATNSKFVFLENIGSNPIMSKFPPNFMFLKQLSTNFFLFLISLIGVATNRRNLLIILMGVELNLLSLNLSFVLFSIYFDDLYGQLFSLFILAIAASESAVGLAVIIIYYRVRGSIFMSQVPVLRS